jgi:hypothetical protein
LHRNLDSVLIKIMLPHAGIQIKKNNEETLYMKKTFKFSFCRTRDDNRKLWSSFVARCFEISSIRFSRDKIQCYISMNAVRSAFALHILFPSIAYTRSAYFETDINPVSKYWEFRITTRVLERKALPSKQCFVSNASTLLQSHSSVYLIEIVRQRAIAELSNVMHSLTCIFGFRWI